jgi:hypothetical protein
MLWPVKGPNEPNTITTLPALSSLLPLIIPAAFKAS